MKRLVMSICALLLAVFLAGALFWTLQRKTEAASATLFSDDFEDGNDDGWTVQAGDWSVIPEYSVYRVSYAGSAPSSRRSYYSTTTSSTWTDYAIQARVKVESTTAINRWGMLIARWQDSSNYYYLAFEGDGDLRIRKYFSSSSYTLGSTSAGLALDTWYTLTLEVSGSTTPTLRAYVDGTPVITATDELGSPFTTGTCALGSYEGTAQFDDVVVTEGGTSMVLLSEDFDDGVADDWVVQAGDWEIFANYVYRVLYEGIGSTGRSYAGSPTWTDYAIQAKVKVESTTENYGMIMARWQDSNNYYYLVFYYDGRVMIRKYAGGSSSIMNSTYAGLALDTWYTLTLEVSGSTTPTLRAYVDGTPVITATDELGSPFTAGQCALGSLRGTVQFDDVLVTDFGASTLTVNSAGSGGGTVTSDPAGIDCGVICTAGFGFGTVVTLTAAADPGDSFAGWMGACNGTGTCVLTMDEAKDVTAVFSSSSDPMLVVHRDGPGSGTVTSSPAGINCGTACAASFSASTLVTLTTAPDVGSTFANWTGGGCSGTDPCTVAMDAAKIVTATFAKGVCGVEMTPPSDAQSGAAGETVTYTLHITNTGNCVDAFDVGVSGDSWPTDAPSSVGPLAAGAGADVEVAVQVPPGAGCGALDDVVVTATSQGDGSTSDSSTLTTSAGTVYGMEMALPLNAQSGEAGTVVAYTLHITNTGNCADTVDLAHASSQGWTVAYDTPVGVGHDKVAMVTVNVTVPSDVLSGTVDTTVVTATSQADGGVWAGVTAVTSAALGDQYAYLPLGLRDYIPYFAGPCEREDNDSFSQANGPLYSGMDYCGYPDDVRDYFSIYVRTGGTIIVDLTGHVGQGVQLQLFYQDSRVTYVWKEPYHIEHTGPPGWYYIFIYTESGYSTTEPYTLRVTYPQ